MKGLPLFYCAVVFAWFQAEAPPLKQPAGISKSSAERVASNIEIVWDNATLKQLSAPDSAAFYPRMVPLKNGILFAVFASNGTITATKSTDGGSTWTTPVAIAEKEPGVNRDTPELLQLQDGTLLLCYASRPQGAMRGKPEEDKKFDIRVKQSGDNGATWGFEKVLYKAGTSAKEGCWEPAALQLPSGEIQVFFANEAIYKKTDEQNISMLRSLDNGITWNAEPQIISFRNGSRDGMPVPIWLRQSNTVAVAIEDPGLQNFKPYIIQSAAGGRWTGLVAGNSPARSYALKTKLEDSIYAGAPYLRQLATGETILSYQSCEGRKRNKDNNAVMIVAIGDRTCKNFKHKTVPFPVPEGRHALWNSLCVVNGDTLIAVTSTNAFSGSGSEVWMIKGTVNRK